jgi:exopolysaccharide biosynthesis polyprenyl glycosylphosphotransferase
VTYDRGGEPRYERGDRKARRHNTAREPTARLAGSTDATVASPSSDERANVLRRAPSPERRSALAWLMDGRGWTVLRITVDWLMLWAAVVLMLRWPGDPLSLREGAALLLFPPSVIAVLALHGAYDRRLQLMPLNGGGPVLGAVSLAVMGLVVVQTYVGDTAFEPGILVHLWVVSIGLVAVGRIATILWQHWARARGLVARPTLIAGAGVVGTTIALRLQEDRKYGLRPIGFLDDAPAPAVSLASDLPVLGRPDQLESVVRATGAEHVVLAFSACSDRWLVPVVRHSKRMGIEVSVVPRLYESLNDRVRYESLGGIPVLGLRGTDPLGWRFLVKHVLDRVIATALLVVLAPLMLALVVAVRASSPGPVLYSQVRAGRDGRAFKLLKFRSMRLEQAGDGGPFEPGWRGPGGVEGSDRRTWIGRFMRRTSLDELPQLINVVKGEMSLIGPRPERPDFVETFERDVEGYGDRHRVKAGITGWAQVHGLRGHTPIGERAEWDNFYIENWSLKLDLRIAMLTLVAMFRSGDD